MKECLKILPPNQRRLVQDTIGCLSCKDSQALATKKKTSINKGAKLYDPPSLPQPQLIKLAQRVQSTL